MLKPLAVQLYSLRQYSEKDFASVIKGVAEIGYLGVEPAGFYDIRPSTFRKVLEDNGLEMVSSHTPWAHENNLGECMDMADSLGLKRIVCGYGPDDFKDLDAVKRTAEKTNKICEVLNANGFEVFQHNHYWEFDRIDGRIAYEIYAEMVPAVKFQIDCFWSTNRGVEDPVAMLKKFADRTILLHMKDGVCKQQAKNDGHEGRPPAAGHRHAADSAAGGRGSGAGRVDHRGAGLLRSRDVEGHPPELRVHDPQRTGPRAQVAGGGVAPKRRHVFPAIRGGGRTAVVADGGSSMKQIIGKRR